MLSMIYSFLYTREAETFSMDYMFMTKKPEGTELLYPILVIKAKKSGGIWALPVIRKGPYLSNIVERVLKNNTRSW